MHRVDYDHIDSITTLTAAIEFSHSYARTVVFSAVRRQSVRSVARESRSMVRRNTIGGGDNAEATLEQLILVWFNMMLYLVKLRNRLVRVVTFLWAIREND